VVPSPVTSWYGADRKLKQGPHPLIVSKVSGTGAPSVDTLLVLVVADTVTGTPPFNFYPVADAGPDTAFIIGKPAVLTGGGHDPDGIIVSWKWAKVSGPPGGNVSYPTRQTTKLTTQAAGTYVYSLTLTDNKGAKATDTVRVTAKKVITPNRQKTR
jgi:hypothetical protein